MKKYRVSYFILLITSLCFIFVQCRKTISSPDYSGLWQKLNTPYFGTPLDIKFISADTGYILGAKYSDDSIYNILLKTDDAGQSWKTIAHANHQFLLDTSDGLMGGIYVSPFNSNIIFSGRNKLIRSIDGGEHWQIINPNPTSFPTYFFDPQNGISAGMFGISITKDGGFTWNIVMSHSSITSLHFTSRDTGYAASGFISTGIAGGFFSNGDILKTNDGGNTWTLLEYPGFNKENKEGPGIFGLNFINNNTGFIYVIDGKGQDAYSSSKIYKTTDGGGSWITINTDLIKKFGYVNNFFMKTIEEGFLTSTNGIFYTKDGCKTWQKETNISVSLITFPNSNTGYAIDTSGAVFKRIF